MSAPVQLNPGTTPNQVWPKDATPPLAFEPDPAWHVPSDEECFGMWDRYNMLDNIRRHSGQVADFATRIAERAVEMGMEVDVPSVRASALLHDIAKCYTISHTGNHAQLGAGIVVDETGNPYIAQGVIHHVYWPWHIDVEKWFLPLVIIYADKRVMHDTVVTIDVRFEDLIRRYAKNEYIRKRIEESHEQGLRVEEELSKRLEIPLNAYTLDCGRLVERA